MDQQQIILQVGVKALLRNKEGKYLLVRRNMEKYKPALGAWDIVGGRINPGTALLENLEREVFEETQLKMVSEPKLIAAQDILHIPGKHVVRLTYIAHAEGTIILDTTENLEYKWLSLEEIKKHEDLDVYLKEILDKDLVS